ncbi:MAG: YihY/virulence factor BrkB family protein [Prevotellaceae bacterium]|jgi:membrane protein|nr:YihY/virulence factor BrkB family protein [Prevotellaceae bacterium]
MKRLVEWYRQSVQFVTYDIWHINKTRVNARDFMLIKLLKVIFIAVRGFFVDKISLRASALTFYTLIAFVPVLAMVIGVAKGFGLNDYLLDLLRDRFAGQKELLALLFDFSESMLSRSRSGLIAGFSVLFLLWAILNLLNNIETSFNYIWQVKRARPWPRKVADYLSVLLIAPILLIVSSSITVVMHARVVSLATELGIYPYVVPVAKVGFKALSYLLLWLVFTFVYVAMPYTKVRPAPALVAGIVAGTLFHAVQNFYIYSQVMASSYSAVYGSFAAVPLFLLWAQASWLILLFGAEISFAAQNVQHYEYGASTQNLSIRERKLLSLLVVHRIVKNFAGGEKPMGSSDIAAALNISVRITRDLLFNLIRCGIVCETVTDDPKVNAYQPAADIHAITVGGVLRRIEERGERYADANEEDSPEKQRLAQLLEQIARRTGEQEGKLKIMEL